MQTRNWLSLTLTSAVAIGGLLLLSSCSGKARYTRTTSGDVVSSGNVAKKTGPPPHAPAHGYRHKHEGVNIVYSKSLGVYTVDGYSGYYFHMEKFYRSTDSGWQISVDVKGPWKSIAKSDLPSGLKESKQKSKGKKKKK
jgi:hypothetical protein